MLALIFFFFKSEGICYLTRRPIPYSFLIQGGSTSITDGQRDIQKIQSQIQDCCRSCIDVRCKGAGACRGEFPNMWIWHCLELEVLFFNRDTPSSFQFLVSSFQFLVSKQSLEEKVQQRPSNLNILKLRVYPNFNTKQ